MLDEKKRSSDHHWEQLRAELMELAVHVGEHAWVDEEGDVPWIDQGELRLALVQAYSSGIDAKVIIACRQACKSSVEFRGRLEDVARDRLDRKRRILLVDDEEAFLEMLKLNLEKTRMYQVRAETSGEAGLACLDEFEPDLVITDLMMPKMDGSEFVKCVRAGKWNPGVPVIVLTALMEPDLSHGVVRDGLLYLAKPIVMKELVHCIEQHLVAHLV